MRVDAHSQKTDSFFRILFTIVAALILLPQFSARAYAEEPTRLRPVRITVLIDRDLWEQNEKSNIHEVRKIINFVSDTFKKDFGITFVVSAAKPFNFFLEDDEINLDTNLEKIRQTTDTDYKDSDAVIGFTAKKQFRCFLRDKEENIARDNMEEKIILKETPCPEKNKIYYAGIADQPGIAAISEFNKFIALHEAGHLFGAKHVSDSGSVMNATVINNAAFDAQSKEIIKQRIEEKFSMPNTPNNQ